MTEATCCDGDGTTFDTKVVTVGRCCSAFLRYVLSKSGESFISTAHSVISVSPYSNIAKIILGVTHSKPMKKPVHNHGVQLKPCITAALESVWIEGTVHCLRIRRRIQE